MGLQTKQTTRLIDARGICLGEVMIQAVEGDYITGQFTPNASFAGVEPLFTELIAAANDQLFRRVDELDAAIASLGLHLASHNGTQLPDIYDVQVDGEWISFRQRFQRPAAEMIGPTCPVQQV
jgi:hypothetical protein